MTAKPKISFVVGLRNPSYGRKYGMDNRYRTQLFVNNLVFWCNKYKLVSELIFVEWNPQKSGEFCNKIVWPKQKSFINIYWIEVPSTIHNRLPNARKISIFEFFAKNVGIRKARSEYILSTNPDLLYSEKLIAYLAKTKLSIDCFYRIDRLDVANYIPRKLSITKKLKFCSRNTVKKHTFYGSFKPDKQGLLYFWKRRSEKKKLIEQYWSGKGVVAFPDGLHRNASGDFFLMAKKHWYKLRGYAELTTHAHIDSIMCWQVATLGLQQINLEEKFKLYHIDHGRTIHKAFPTTNWVKWYERFKQCQLTNKTLIINDKNWGLAQESLKQVKIL